MRRILTTAFAAACVFSCATTARAQNGQLQGFGGLTFGDVTNSSTFGGGIAVPLTDNVQIIGEGGRMTNVLPSTFYNVLEFTPFEVHMSAWYGEGGVRFIGSSRRAIRPYAEATAGMARLSPGFEGAGSADNFINGALGFYSKTEPLLGVGGGVIVQGGPIFLDLGYRYKKILVDESLASLLTGGGDFGVNQVRIGAGVRF
jgi:opacity protein-like surface antigen